MTRRDRHTAESEWRANSNEINNMVARNREYLLAKHAKKSKITWKKIFLIVALALLGAGLYSTNTCVEGVRCSDN